MNNTMMICKTVDIFHCLAEDCDCAAAHKWTDGCDDSEACPYFIRGGGVCVPVQEQSFAEKKLSPEVADLVAAARELADTIQSLLESDDHAMGGDLWKFVNDTLGPEYKDARAALAPFETEAGT